MTNGDEVTQYDKHDGYYYQILLKGNINPIGRYHTRHEAVGEAAILARIVGRDFEITWMKSIWRRKDEPDICEQCGRKEWYLPLIGWQFHEEGKFCSSSCWKEFCEANGKDTEQVTQR